MTTAGWIFMFGSVTAVLSLSTWCYYKILTVPARDGDADESGDGAAGSDTPPSR